VCDATLEHSAEQAFASFDHLFEVKAGQIGKVTGLGAGRRFVPDSPLEEARFEPSVPL
jgi:hypothetical protein